MVWLWDAQNALYSDSTNFICIYIVISIAEIFFFKHSEFLFKLLFY